MVRKRVEFTGRVQGVGFRMRTLRIAAGFPVTGWVRNEDDGSVSMEVQGEQQAVSAFCKAIEAEMGSLIRHSATADVAIVSGDGGFEIRA